MMIVEDSPARQFLQGLGEQLGRPKAILIASGHWVTEGLGIVAAERPEMIYDISGFPQALYDIAYGVFIDHQCAKDCFFKVPRLRRKFPKH